MSTDTQQTLPTAQDHARALVNSVISKRKATGAKNPRRLRTKDRVYALVQQGLEDSGNAPGQRSKGKGKTKSRFLNKRIIGAAGALLKPDTNAISRSLTNSVTTPSSIPTDMANVIKWSICTATTQLLQAAYINADKINIELNDQIRIIYERLLYAGYYRCSQPEWYNGLMPNFLDAASKFCAAFKDRQLNHQCNEPWNNNRPQSTAQWNPQLSSPVVAAPAYGNTSGSVPFRPVPLQNSQIQSTAQPALGAMNGVPSGAPYSMQAPPVTRMQAAPVVQMQAASVASTQTMRTTPNPATGPTPVPVVVPYVPIAPSPSRASSRRTPRSRTPTLPFPNA